MAELRKEQSPGWDTRYVVFTDGVRSEHSYCNKCDSVMIETKLEVKFPSLGYQAKCKDCGAEQR